MEPEVRERSLVTRSDEIFDGIQRIYEVDIIDERDLGETTIERWRWDEPAISLTWTGGSEDWITRNLVCTSHESVEALRFTVEINAWLDVDVPPDGEGRIRYWHHEVIADGIKVNPHVGSLRPAIIEAFLRASEIRREDLTRVEELSR